MMRLNLKVFINNKYYHKAPFSGTFLFIFYVNGSVNLAQPSEVKLFANDPMIFLFEESYANL